MEIVEQTREDSKLAQDYNDAKKSINASYEYDDPERQLALEEIKDEFEFLKAGAASERAVVEAKADELKNNISTRDKWMESMEQQMLDEAKKDHQYGVG